jgi:hypothetical protein
VGGLDAVRRHIGRGARREALDDVERRQWIERDRVSAVGDRRGMVGERELRQAGGVDDRAGVDT